MSLNASAPIFDPVKAQADLRAQAELEATATRVAEKALEGQGRRRKTKSRKSRKTSKKTRSRRHRRRGGASCSGM